MNSTTSVYSLQAAIQRMFGALRGSEIEASRKITEKVPELLGEMK